MTQIKGLDVGDEKARSKGYRAMMGLDKNLKSEPCEMNIANLIKNIFAVFVATTCMYNDRYRTCRWLLLQSLA